MSLEGVSKSFPENPVLDEISVGISAGDHIGVIGRNGSGKSTLLAIIAGREEPDAGVIIRARDLRISQLFQDPQFPPGSAVGDILGSDRPAIAMAHRLGLDDLEAGCEALSGGQRKRLSLTVALTTECDLLILDEPTNHLDVDSIDWLEDHLRGRREALLLVTHDRFLLDRVANRVLEVHDRSLYVHQGNYQGFLEAVAAREEQESAAAHRLKQRIRTELAWLRRSPKARTTKSQARIDRANDLIAQQRKTTRSELTIDLPSRRIGSKVVVLEGAGKRYGGQWVLRDVNYRLQPDARIGVVGPNGAGKTTLLSLIAGRIHPDEGTVTLGSTVHPGWYGQDPRPIPPETRLRDVVHEYSEEVRLSSGIRVSGALLLERFLFSRDQQQALVGELSGGERRRLELLLSLIEAPNLLLLDEPTNDLDIDTLGVLEEYLDTWEGAVVVASHDRYLLERTCSDIFSIGPEGRVQHHPGGWSAYRAAQQEGSTVPPQAPGAAPRIKQRSKRLSYNDQRELDTLTKAIPRLERDRDRIETDLAAETDNVAVIAELSSALAAAMAGVDEAETRWLELTHKAEQMAIDHATGTDSRSAEG